VQAVDSVYAGSAWAVGPHYDQGNAQYNTIAEPGILVVDLGLGNFQNPTIIGTVQFNRQDSHLIVTYTTNFPYFMDQVHLYVGTDIPPPSGAPGSFPYQATFINPVSTYTFIVDISAFEGQTISVAAHAHIVQQV
jgi:hypothetical protein